jgi:hypothetical protein
VRTTQVGFFGEPQMDSSNDKWVWRPEDDDLSDDEWNYLWSRAHGITPVKRGRPKGSKNKKLEERPSKEALRQRKSRARIARRKNFSTQTRPWDDEEKRRGARRGTEAFENWSEDFSRLALA